MDPVSILVMALVVGAAAGLQSTAKTAVSDAYAGLKDLLHRKFGQTVDVAAIERDPKSKERQDILKEELASTNAETDQEVLTQAKVLLDAVQSSAPEVLQIVGVSLEDIEAGAVRLKQIESSGSGAVLKRVKTSGDIDIEGVKAGQGGDQLPDPTGRQ